jgi:hypothetical protein
MMRVYEFQLKIRIIHNILFSKLYFELKKCHYPKLHKILMKSDLNIASNIIFN